MSFKPEKIPQSMAEKFSAITALTDAFCSQWHYLKRIRISNNEIEMG